MILSGDSIRVVHPLFPVEGDGSIPISPLQLHFGDCSLDYAKAFNKKYHSRLPVFRQTIAKACFSAIYKNRYYACAIWSNPSSAMIDKTWIELKRFVITDDAPKNTASRMMSWMVREIKKRFPECPRIISYQDPQVHDGTIYKASGWVNTGSRKSGGFSNTKVRYREKDQAPGDKIRWEKMLLKVGT